MGNFWGSPTLAFPTDKHIVIVGGGYAGLGVAAELLDGGANFTLISARDGMHHNMASVRAAVEPGYAAKTIIPLAPMLGKHFRLGKVVNVKAKENKVVLESGEEVDYDVLIIATGTGGSFPNKLSEEESREDALNEYEALCKKIKDSQRIVVVGGGPTGIEQACEVAYKYPEKEVTIVTNRDKLIGGNMTDNFLNRTKAILQQLGVKVIYGERVENMVELNDVSSGPVTVRTDKGTTLEADHVFSCGGLGVSCEAYKNGLGDAMDETRGQLRVNEYLQVEGHDNIFALGDCNNVECLKLAYIAGMQAAATINNLRKMLNDQPMTAYNPAVPVEMMLVLGPERGLGQTTGGWIIPEFVSIRFKSRGMLVDKFWTLAKQQVPS